MSLQPIYIAGSSIGLELDKKPYLLPDQAYIILFNAYVWRDRVVKKQGSELLGRLSRRFNAEPIGNTGASPWTFNLYTLLSITEPTAEIQPGSVVFVIGGAITISDNGDGTLSSVTVGNSGIINYITGAVTLIHTAGAGVAVTVSLFYYPSLPVMGELEREQAGINDEETIYFDTVYAYKFTNGIGFEEYIAGTTWSGDDWQLFSSCNYRGSTPQSRLFFVTNFNNGQSVLATFDPIRYTDGATWTNFAPLVSATDTLFQARILIPYFGRLLALNVWEGTTAGGQAAAANIGNRCRFSQIGDPTAADAWRSDLFGKGGFIDAPVNEDVISASFFKNTLIVGFEQSTWQLRYVGEYGLPFIWERISSDFGTESTFSNILFDQGVASVGDKAIVSATSNTVNRIDQKIPDIVFSIKNETHGPERVYGVRDFERELTYWSYRDGVQSDDDGIFPNRVLVYNYRNDTWAQFRDNITCFGLLNAPRGINWSRTDVFWDDYTVTWDDPYIPAKAPVVITGNQQGYVHLYQTQSLNDPSLSISAIDLTTSPIRLTVVDHNFGNTDTPNEGTGPGRPGELVYLTGALFVDGSGVPVSTDLNNEIYLVKNTVPYDPDIVELWKWDPSSGQYIPNFAFTPDPLTSTYIGGGQLSLLPIMDISTKDFNPFAGQGSQLFMSYVDFLTNSTEDGAVSINLYLNASFAIKGNVDAGNTQVETKTTYPYYPTTTASGPLSEYAWHRFFATLTGQFIRIEITYDDDLANIIGTHQQDYELNAIVPWVRKAGKVIF